MEEGYLNFVTDEMAAFNLEKFLTDLKLEGLLSRTMRAANMPSGN
jgi:hypothetical protein